MGEEILLFGGVWFPDKEEFYMFVLLPGSLVPAFPGFPDFSTESAVASNTDRPLGIERQLWDGHLVSTKWDLNQAEG